MHKVGTSATDPPTHYYWSTQYNATAKATHLDDLCIVRASKALRLVSQEDDRTEYWASNLSKLNSYLAGRSNTSGGGFRFRLSVDYIPESSASVTVDQQEAAELVTEMKQVESQLQGLRQERRQAHNQVQNGFEEFVEQNQERLGGIEGRITQTEEYLEQLGEQLERKRQAQNAWEDNGVIQTYIIEVTTDAELVPTQQTKPAAQEHVEEVSSTVESSVRRALEGSNFRLLTEEVEAPRVLLDLEHMGLASPENLKHLVEAAPPRAEDELRNLQESVARQYFASALEDVITGEGEVVEREKSTPAWSVQGILKQLDEEDILTEVDVDPPQTGPSIGTVPGTNRYAGFDPAEHGPHYYIAGSTGTGKTHLGRVLMENAASLGYNTLYIDPRSLQGIGLSLPNNGLEEAEGHGIEADHYWTGNHLRSIPDDFNELVNGVNTVSLRDEPVTEAAAVTASILDEIDNYDFSDNPLFVFLEEADNFAGTVAIDPLRTLLQEGRKFGVHVVLISQRPKAFNYTEKDIRKETSYILMNRQYDQQNLGRLFDIDATNLDQGEAVFVDFLDIPEMVVDVRDTVTRLWSGTPDEQEIQQVDDTAGDRSMGDRFPDLSHMSTGGTGEDRSRSSAGPELGAEQQEVVEAIQTYTNREGQAPSQNKVIEEGEFGAGKTRNILEELIDSGVVETDTDTRYGNKATVYKLV